MLLHDYECPVCKYEFKQAYGDPNPSVGDERPVSLVLKHAELTIPGETIYDSDKKADLTGCPKCKSVTFNSYW